MTSQSVGSIPAAVPPLSAKCIPFRNAWSVRSVRAVRAWLGRKPVRSRLVHALVQLDRDYSSEARSERWEDWYAARLDSLLL